MNTKSWTGSMLVALLIVPVALAASSGEQDDLEAFREQLSQTMRELNALPPELVEVVYDDPASLATTEETVAALTEEQLRALRETLRQVPYWDSLPGLLSSSFTERARRLQSHLSSGVSAMTVRRSPDEFRTGWLDFFGTLDELPDDVADEAFRGRLTRVQESMSSMEPQELAQLQEAMMARMPEWSAKLEQAAQAVGWQGPSAVERSLRMAPDTPLARQLAERYASETTAPEDLQSIRPSGSSFAEVGRGSMHLGGSPPELPAPETVPDPAPAGCPSGLNGVLCEIGEILDAIINFPGQVIGFVVDTFNDLINFLSPLVDLPDDALDFFSSVIDFADPDWFLDTVAQIPPLNPPCPAAGTFIPGIGEVGTPRATFVCKRGLDWGTKALYDLAPDDIWGVPAKLILAAIYYPVNYLCLCFQEASEVRFDDMQAAHRELVEGRLDVQVLTRVSQTTLNAASADVADLDGDVAAIEAKLDVLEAKTDDLLDGEGLQSGFLDDFRALSLRMRIEADLLREGNSRISLFQLPETASGLIEVVQVIVEATVQARLDAGHDVGQALEQIFKGDQDYAIGKYKQAYGHYREAYVMAVAGPRHDDDDD